MQLCKPAFALVELSHYRLTQRAGFVPNPLLHRNIGAPDGSCKRGVAHVSVSLFDWQASGVIWVTKDRFYLIPCILSSVPGPSWLSEFL